MSENHNNNSQDSPDRRFQFNLKQTQMLNQPRYTRVE